MISFVAHFIHFCGGCAAESRLQAVAEVWSLDCASAVCNGHNPSGGGFGRLHVALGGEGWGVVAGCWFSCNGKIEEQKDVIQKLRGLDCPPVGYADAQTDYAHTQTYMRKDIWGTPAAAASRTLLQLPCTHSCHVSRGDCGEDVYFGPLVWSCSPAGPAVAAAGPQQSPL